MQTCCLIGFHLWLTRGQLILATPFTWLEEFTPVENWIGSKFEEKLHEKLNQILFWKKAKIFLLIREHRRKFQFSVSLGT